MPNQTQAKALPSVIRMRAERILKKGAKAAYRVDDNDANLLKVILTDNQVRYVNLAERREVKSTELKVSLVDDDQRSGKLTETQQDNTAMVTREDVSPAPKKATRKKTVTKKKSTKK